MTRHVSTENLARFRGGELSSARSARIAAHLRTCARCRETSEALARIPSLLSAVEVPPMPAHLAARIESALATESAHRAAREPDGVPEHQRTRSAGGARRRPRRPVLAMPAVRVLATVGAAVVLVGGSVALLTQLGSGSSSGGSEAGGGATASSPGHKAAVLGPRMTPGFTTFGGVHYQHGQRLAVITPQRSGTDYQSGRLTQQVSHVMSSVNGPMMGTPNVAPNGHSGQPTSHGRSTLPGCVNRIAAGHRVQLVDIARYNGKPATIIVTARHGQVAAEIWVVGATCSASASDVLTSRPLPRG